MFLRNHTLKHSKRMDTTLALKVFSNLCSGLTPACTRIGNLSIAQLAFLSKVSLKTCLDKSSHVYFLETANKHKNSPMFGHPFFVRLSSSTRNVLIFRSTLTCKLGYWRKMESKR